MKVTKTTEHSIYVEHKGETFLVSDDDEGIKITVISNKNLAIMPKSANCVLIEFRK